MRDLADLVAEVAPVRPPRFVCPLWLARLGAAVHARLAPASQSLINTVSLRALRGNRRIRHERATRELGYHPRPLRATLIDTFRWFEEVGMLTRRAGTQGRGSAWWLKGLSMREEPGGRLG
jgi:dihydroflavonol-4-reductase